MTFQEAWKAMKELVEATKEGRCGAEPHYSISYEMDVYEDKCTPVCKVWLEPYNVHRGDTYNRAIASLYAEIMCIPSYDKSEMPGDDGGDDGK